MNTNDLNNKLLKAAVDIHNKLAKPTEIKALLKEADMIIKKKQRYLKDVTLISKIAKNNNVTVFTKKQKDITFHGVPIESKQFFDKFITESEYFTINEIDYIIVYKSDVEF